MKKLYPVVASTLKKSLLIRENALLDAPTVPRSHASTPLSHTHASPVETGLIRMCIPSSGFMDHLATQLKC